MEMPVAIHANLLTHIEMLLGAAIALLPRFGETGEDRKSGQVYREPRIDEVVPEVSGVEELKTEGGEGENDREKKKESTSEPREESDRGEAEEKSAYPTGIAERIGIERCEAESHRVQEHGTRKHESGEGLKLTPVVELRTRGDRDGGGGEKEQGGDAEIAHDPADVAHDGNAFDGKK
jgi:hypothetical protein